MATITIDGISYEVDAGRNVLHAALQFGLDLPYHCWHPAFGSSGACRQCAVKQFQNADDDQGQVVMACMTPCEDGTIVSIHDEEATRFRHAVGEWLMVNHPHDCPVCDEGGECHLQDMTRMTGQTYRRHRFKKRTYRNQDLGPLIHHEMNRCIQCYRCVNYYQSYAGGDDLQAMAAHDHVYFGRATDGTLQSPFAGNLVEVCPTGVFTDKTLKPHYTRKWDLQTAPSVCPHCAVGCNVTPGERYGTLRRIRNRYHGAVNGYFLCDRGRYGYGFVNHERRIRQPLRPRGQDRVAEPIGVEPAIDRIARAIGGGSRVVGVGSPRASIESNFMLRRLVGADRFVHGVGAREAACHAAIVERLRTTPARLCSIRDLEAADVVLVLGENLTHTAPRVRLAIEQATRNRPRAEAEAVGIPSWHYQALLDHMQTKRGPLFVLTPFATDMDRIACAAQRAAPERIARLAVAVAHHLDNRAPEPGDLADEERALADRIAGALRNAERPVIVGGSSLRHEPLIHAAADLAAATARSRDEPTSAALLLTATAANSVGLALLGGEPLDALLDDPNDAPDVAIVLENDLYRRFDRARLTPWLEQVKHLVVLDHHAHETAARAELVLPAATWAEAHGTFVNHEARAQRFHQVFVPEGAIEAGWQWLDRLIAASGRGTKLNRLATVHAAMAEAEPLFAPLTAAESQTTAAPPRQPFRYSGRTAMNAHRDVHEPQPQPTDPDSPLRFSMEGRVDGQPPAALAAEFEAPLWSSNEALNKFQEEIDGPLRGGDPGVRLIVPEANRHAYAAQPPATPRAPDGQHRLVARYRIFGSEPLSAMSPGVADLSEPGFLALSEQDAAALDAVADELLELVLDRSTARLPLRIDPSLPVGVAAVTVGLTGSPAGELPDFAEVRKP